MQIRNKLKIHGVNALGSAIAKMIKLQSLNINLSRLHNIIFQLFSNGLNNTGIG